MFKILVLLYGFVVDITVQLLVTTITGQRDPYESCNIINATFALGNVHNPGLPTSKRLPDPQECIGYIVSVISLIVPLTLSGMSWVFNFDPINIHLDNVIPEIPRKIFAATCYGTLAFAGAQICWLFILHCITIYQYSENLSLQNLNESKLNFPNSHCSVMNRIVLTFFKVLIKFIEKLYPRWRLGGNHQFRHVYKIRKLGSESVTVRFRHCRFIHHQLQIILCMCNQNTLYFMPTMALVGVYLCTICNYMIVNLLETSEFQSRIAFTCAIMMDVAVYWVTLFLAQHASETLLRTKAFIDCWKGNIHLGKLERKQVRAMSAFGFKIGPFLHVKKSTALDIFAFIFNYTTTLLINDKS